MPPLRSPWLELRLSRRPGLARVVLMRAVLCLAALLAAVVPQGCGPDTTAGGPITSPCPPGAPCQVRLTLLHTSDIHSRLFPFDLLITQIDSGLGLGSLGDVRNVGGASRLAYVLGRERARSGRVLHLDSGDCFQGAPVFNFFSGEPEVRVQSLIGTDAEALGNHEFDKGPLNITTQFQRWSNFPLLAANYKFDDPSQPSSAKLGTVVRPYQVFNVDGLKVAVIGMGNLSSLTSIFDQPNKSGINPIVTTEVAQFYVDLLRPIVDVIVLVTHLGLEVDERMVRGTTGIDVVLGGHNHIVINPPQQLRDCSADENNPGWVWAVDPNKTLDPADISKPGFRPADSMFKRACKPRNVIIAHSGAFAKYVGRLDLQLSNDPALVSPTGTPEDYDRVNGFEVLSSQYIPFPIESSVPTDPVVERMLEPYRRTLDVVADLDTVVGFSPLGAKRTAPLGGDSPLGNLVATAMWLRLGIQTDFSLTNTTGIRADLNPGPITVESMYNIFPFDNSITKMQLSGIEVQELFDFVATRSAKRGCAAQSQIAGARVRVGCSSCEHESSTACTTNSDCDNGDCDTKTQRCRLNACASEIYIGNVDHPCQTDNDCGGRPGSCSVPHVCQSDTDCGGKVGSCNVNTGLCAGKPGQCLCASDNECKDSEGKVHAGACDVDETRRCLSRIAPTNLYELATSNYLAGGGSGYRVLQRNTTQFDTKIQQRDALIDYLRQGRSCGYKSGDNRTNGLLNCQSDDDCKKEASGLGDFVCACPGRSYGSTLQGASACVTGITDDAGKHIDSTCAGVLGQCVLRSCRDQVADFQNLRCKAAPDKPSCLAKVNACSLAGESCKILSCVDKSVGAFTDRRMEMSP